MTAKHIEPGDINIIKIELSKLSGSQRNINLLPQVLSMSIYEDINEPSMMLEITMVDSINLVQDYPIIGEELISISVHTPGRENPTKIGFLIFSVDSTGVHPTSKASTYTIKAVTPIHFFSAATLIEKTYNSTVDEIVTDIIRTTTASSTVKTSKLFVEKTKGLVPITIPKLNPFQAIDMLRQKAISAEYQSGGSFLFFENQFGMQFRSIEGLLEEGKKQIASKSFTYAPDTSSDKTRMQYAFRNILRFKNTGKFDSIEKMESGVITGFVESLDIFTKQKDKIEFKLAEKAKTFTSTDNKSKLPNSNEFIERISQTPGKRFYMTKDSSKGNDFIDVNFSTKFAYLKLLNQNSVRVLVHGDTYLAAGDLIELNLPEVSGTTEKKNFDSFNSGNYLITRLRHIITVEEGGKPKHSISMDCARMGYK